MLLGQVVTFFIVSTALAAFLCWLGYYVDRKEEGR